MQKISLDKDAVYDIDTGYLTVHIEVKDGAARFIDSPCPDHICESFGWISQEDQTATCLPARAVLTIVPLCLRTCQKGEFLCLMKLPVPTWTMTAPGTSTGVTAHRKKRLWRWTARPFFAPETAAPTPPPAPPKPPKHTGGPAPESKPPRRKPDADTGAANPKRGTVLLILQAILSIAAFLQLWRTQMLPALYLVIIAALLVLFWLLVKRCQEYSAPLKVSRVFSVFLCAFLALGCVWAQQGLSALDNVTSGLVTGTEANKITKEPFVVYLSGVDNRGELTEKARSDVNILAVVNPPPNGWRSSTPPVITTLIWRAPTARTS